MDFSAKKIAILGLGIEGEDTVKFLLSQGAKNITVFDQKPLRDLKEKIKKLQIRDYELGKNYLQKGLRSFDIIFRSPAFKLSLPEIVEAKKKGILISSATKLFFDLCPGKIIGVTGTKGKGTTATLIYKILKKAKKEVFLAGNIGKPMLSLLPKLNKKSWIILELSSFQLQDIEKSPHIATVLFIAPEHLNYHLNIKEYVQAKSNIVRYQRKTDFAVLNTENQISASFAKLTPAKVYWFSQRQKVNGAYVLKEKIYLMNKLIGSTEKLKLLGKHNWENVCAAIITAHLAGANPNEIRKTIFSFRGLEHRLELVRKIKGISFYNDSFSTTPETTIAAIKAFNQPIILIAGGSEKSSNFNQLGKEIANSAIKALILIGKEARRIKDSALKGGFKGEIILKPKNMQEIIETAMQKAKPGDIVLLSPACASFDMFKNYKDRGEQFKKYVQEIKDFS